MKSANDIQNTIIFHHFLGVLNNIADSAMRTTCDDDQTRLLTDKPWQNHP